MNKDAQIIINESIQAVLPHSAVLKALENKNFNTGKTIIVSIGKAAYSMALVASKVVSYDKGFVITKYGHAKKDIQNFEIMEAGHPVLDENAIIATEKILKEVSTLNDNDTVLFLVSGGGSALFEKPLISLKELQDITTQLLKSGASISEINTIRKRLSDVKGGKFAKHVSPAKVYQIVLSDIVGDPLDMIASGPCVSDTSSCKDALSIIEKYHIVIKEETRNLLLKETPKDVDNVETAITGSVKELCNAAKRSCEKLGYQTRILKTDVQDIASKAAKEFALQALEIENKPHLPTALIMGGETLVEVKGNGLGGRNQEFALTAAQFIQGKNITIFSLGSDGTDGPTDAAGGIVDGFTIQKCKEKNINVEEVLQNNDSYHALKTINSLIVTSPTGTNVNDVMVALIP